MLKKQKKKRCLAFSSKNKAEYNLPFSITELKQSSQRVNNSATGLDQVLYQLLTDLPNSALSVLLKMYNHVWEYGCFLPSWHKAVVIPIPKPRKDHSEPGIFRPIALTSSLYKTMERMNNTHLLKPNWKPSSSHSIFTPTNISTQFLLQSLYVCVCECNVCMCMCVHACMCACVFPYNTLCKLFR